MTGVLTSAFSVPGTGMHIVLDVALKGEFTKLYNLSNSLWIFWNANYFFFCTRFMMHIALHADKKFLLLTFKSQSSVLLTSFSLHLLKLYFLYFCLLLICMKLLALNRYITYIFISVLFYSKFSQLHLTILQN